MKKLVFGLFFFSIAVALLIWLQLPTAVQQQAVVEEAQLFEEEFAELFGEEPEVGTRLVLHRIEAAGGAVIGRDGEELVLRTGDTLVEPCLRLAEVFDDAVLLDSCGAYRLLSLGEQNFEASVPRDGRVGERAPAVVDYRYNPRARELIGDYHQRLYRRPLSLRGELDVELREDNNGERQLLLFPGRDPRLFSQLPLQSGDQLVAVNGIAVSAEGAVNSIYSQLVGADRLTLTLERAGRDVVVLLAM